MSFPQYTAREVINSFPRLLYSGNDGNEGVIVGMYSLIQSNSNSSCWNYFQIKGSVRGLFICLVPGSYLVCTLLCSSISLIKHTRPFITRQLISLRKCWGRGQAPLTHPYDHPFQAEAINPVFSHGSVSLKRIFNLLLIDWVEIECTSIWKSATVI